MSTLGDLSHDKAQRTGLLLPMSVVAVVAFGAGAATIAYFKQQPWAWNSPLSLTCLALAALVAGIAVMNLILARAHDAEADALRESIENSRVYARALISRGEHSQ